MRSATESLHQDFRSIRVESSSAIWHKSAPQAIHKAYWIADEAAGWKAWRRHLRTRRLPAKLDKDDSSVLWGLDSETAELVLLPFAKTSEALHEIAKKWLNDAAVARASLDDALSAIAVARSLPQLALELEASLWWQLLDHLIGIVNEAGALSGDDPLLRQLLLGELPYTLAYLLPEIVACRDLETKGAKVLSAGLADLLDGEGLPHAGLLDRLPALLACWARSRMLQRRGKPACWDAAAEWQYQQLVRNVLRLARRDGSLVFSKPMGMKKCNVALLAAALAVGGDKDDHAIAAANLPAGISKKPQGGSAGRPSAAVHSEWAAMAMLRPNWSRSAPRLAVLYPNTECKVELACGRDVLFSGTWAFDLAVDGVKAAVTSDWTQICWVSDEDSDYLELEIDLGDGVRVQRHLLLARQDRILLMADAVLASKRASFDYRSTLPLWPGINFKREGKNTECVLTGQKPRARAIPLALGEWAAKQGAGEFTPHNDRMELRQHGEGLGLFAPVLFDLNPSRFGKPLTWRQLTVAESWAIQTPDVAAGYRLAVGNKQWLIYRSLSPAKNRTLLGHNLSSGMLVARFLRDGEVETIIEIE